MIWTLVRTDFKVRYHGTAGGFVWALLKPLTMFVMLMAVFSFVFASDPNYKLNLIIGLFLWDFFAEGTKAGLIVAARARVSADEGALSRRGFSSSRRSSNALITLRCSSAIMFAFLAWAGHPPSRWRRCVFLAYCVRARCSSSSAFRWRRACSSCAIAI